LRDRASATNSSSECTGSLLLTTSTSGEVATGAIHWKSSGL
jgi:hypothetical protein